MNAKKIQALKRIGKNPFIPYEDLVVRFIRERYSVDEELAILRQRDNKPEKFSEYNSFVEECKEKAKKIVSEYPKE